MKLSSPEWSKKDWYDEDFHTERALDIKNTESEKESGMYLNAKMYMYEDLEKFYEKIQRLTDGFKIIP